MFGGKLDSLAGGGSCRGGWGIGGKLVRVFGGSCSWMVGGKLDSGGGGGGASHPTLDDPVTDLPLYSSTAGRRGLLHNTYAPTCTTS